MAKYQLLANGVLDTEEGWSIPNAPGNRHWKEFQVWLAYGNTPDPDPNDYLLAAKQNRIAEIWTEAKALTDGTVLPGKRDRMEKQHARRTSKLARGRSLSAAEDAAQDAYDAHLDWVDSVYDAAQSGEDTVEAASDIPATAVVVIWPTSA